MRIISGTHKGKRISAPKKLPVRPTTDMAKEALFNILNNRYYFDELTVVDLFSGTGNISYEFASRGTKNISAVDADYGCVKFINDTSDTLEMGIAAFKSDVFTYLEKSREKATIIFADPPYDLPIESFEKIPQKVFENGLLLDNGLLIIEHSSHMDLSHLEHFVEKRKYGGSIFSFFAWPEPVTL
ncbi:16S rRNA (guanine(966)-N(2))-methyltransferase RsmD [Zobellia sp. OII3]|uniref:RsmD family RNA methyltransferase n=1 Tax=Zobellia sp. OII3 TaxID=2034520 RepID=UPI000B52FB3B|nr:RsmD family RNA methyltransferase [Zobellia sp. OII3]OWW23850.1 16S rRNA (guanine(966)-N(2))-methyltransferase RsmD [Zobellia sp. OII3]